MSRKEAPFTDAEVQSINDFQNSGVFHEFTCAYRDTHSGDCRRTLQFRDDVLVAYNDGLRCPSCAYTQTWVHSWMADRSWTDSPLAWRK